MNPRTFLLLLATSSLFLSTSCHDHNTSMDGKITVITTISPITSIVENIGGNLVYVQGIVPEGANSHTFEPAPSVARLIANANLIVMNGLFLEEPSLRIAKASKNNQTKIIRLGNMAITRDQWVFDFSFPENKGHPNPHLWTNPVLGLKYGEIIRDELVSLDPTNKSYYQDNYDALKIRIEDLDKRIQVAIDTIPQKNRKLLTYHDSFPLFAKRYGLEIIAAVQPSDFTEPSARSVASLIDQIRGLGIPAIFGSAVFPSPVMEHIANESNVLFVDQLRDDDLPGKPGDQLHSYLGLILKNTEIMVSALEGNPDPLTGFDTGPVFQGGSGALYPQ